SVIYVPPKGGIQGKFPPGLFVLGQKFIIEFLVLIFPNGIGRGALSPKGRTRLQILYVHVRPDKITDLQSWKYLIGHPHIPKKSVPKVSTCIFVYLKIGVVPIERTKI